MKTLLASLFISMGVVFLSPALPVNAYNAYKGVCNDPAAQNSTVCKEKTTQNPIAGNDGVLIKITNIIAYIAGAAAVIVILLGAFKYLTSGSDMSTNTHTDNDVEEAKSMIAGALIGLAIIVLARTIINYVVIRI